MTDLRFILGILLPLLVEFGLYETYLYLNPNFTPTLDILFLLIPLMLLLLNIFILSPNLIYFASRIGKDYKSWLENYLDRIFDENKELLEETEKSIIRRGIQQEVIPSLQSELREEYMRKFHNRGFDVLESSLTYQEALFLFSVFSIVTNIINIGLMIYIHYNSIRFSAIYIDQITDIGNILLFISVFFIFLLISVFLFVKSQKEIKYLLSLSLSGLFPEINSLKQEASKLKLEAFKNFDWDQLDPRIMQTETIQQIIKETIYSDLLNLIRESILAEAGKRLIWKKYNSILEKIELPEKKKERIEKSFFSLDVFRAAKSIISEEEFLAIKNDLLNVQKKIEIWNDMTEEDRITGFLYLFRVLETIFRNILIQFGVELGQPSFHSMTSLLWNLELINRREKDFLHTIRIRRNEILHNPGHLRPIDQQTMKTMQELVENILVKVKEEIRE
ncbi:MAG: hypothetical protein ACFFBD_26655 [Candidatus Hodarchaeota archaeon]